MVVAVTTSQPWSTASPTYESLSIREGWVRRIVRPNSFGREPQHNHHRRQPKEEDGGGTVNVTKGGEAVNMQDLLDLLPVAVGCVDTIASAPPIEAFIVPDDVQPVIAMRL